MAKKFEIFRCNICGNIIEILEGGAGELVCCNEPMELIDVKNEETVAEKHKPVISSEGENIKIRVGEVLHPMTKEHHIEFIEAISLDGKYLYRKYLTTEEQPIMEFFCKTGKMRARELCNIHGFFETINE